MRSIRLNTVANKVAVYAAAALLVASACDDGTGRDGSMKAPEQHDGEDDGDETDANQNAGSMKTPDQLDDPKDDSRQRDGGGKPKTPKMDASSGSKPDVKDAAVADTGSSTTPAADGLPAGADKIAGIEFFQRVIGKWTGINSNTPIGFDFPMTVDIAVSGESLLFGKYELDADNNVLWGFNIETYDGKDVLAYRNGGYLFGLRRDSRAKLVEHDTARGFYRFCAALEHGLPVDGCNYIDATYTFSAPDSMLFEVKTRSGEPHVHWEARRIETHALPDPFPASIESQGNGAAKWPAAAGIP